MASHLARKLFGRGKPKSTSPAELLADRELEVFHLVGRGYGTRQIAEEMHLGIKTIESYKARIKEKLALADANQLLLHAIEWSHGDYLDRVS
jgi:DNA-binding NarL/FixJ family response regulator